MRRRILIGALVAAVVVVAAAIAWPRGGTPIDRRQAVAEFRKTASDGSGKATATSSTEPGDLGAPLHVPDVGVYTYTASGKQETKFGPLPTETRILPPEVVASVTQVSDPEAGGTGATSGEAACFSYELNLFAEHIEVTTSCLEPFAGAGADAGSTQMTIASHIKKMKVGPLTATATLACDTPLVLVPGKSATGLPCALILKGGPIEVNADLVGSTSVGEVETVQVGGQDVRVRKVTIEYAADGKVSGVWSETMWMTESDWLPVRTVRHVNLVGPATIIEDSELVLGSIEPTT